MARKLVTRVLYGRKRTRIYRYWWLAGRNQYTGTGTGLARRPVYCYLLLGAVRAAPVPYWAYGFVLRTVLRYWLASMLPAVPVKSSVLLRRLQVMRLLLLVLPAAGAGLLLLRLLRCPSKIC